MHTTTTAARTMMMMLLLTLTACASTATQAGTEPLRYPALPVAESGSTELSAFDPAPTLSVLALACRAEELPLANAIDDDCNGQVDDAPTSAPLVIAIAYPAAAALALALRTDDQQLELAASACDDSQAYCSLQLSTDKLARGRHALVVHPRPAIADSSDPSSAGSQAQQAQAPAASSASSSSARAEEPRTSTVVVSVQSRGKVTTYLALLDATTSEQTLGELALP